MESEKIFRRIQLIVGSLFIITILMKSLKVPLMGILIVISGSLLFLLFFAWMFFSLITKWKVSKGIALLLFFIHFTSLSGIISIMFSVMFWPFGLPMAMAAIIFFSWFVLTPGLIYYIIKGHKRDDFWPLLRFDLIKTIILIAFGAFIFSLSKDQRIDIFSADPERTRENLKKQEMEDRQIMEKMNQQ